MDAPFASPTSVLNRYYTKRQGGAFAFVVSVIVDKIGKPAYFIGYSRQKVV